MRSHPKLSVPGGGRAPAPVSGLSLGWAPLLQEQTGAGKVGNPHCCTWEYSSDTGQGAWDDLQGKMRIKEAPYQGVWFAGGKQLLS